jgi:addiction module RelB/DinJ family antitoxin
MKTVIHIKADKEVKETAQRVAEELGVSLSTVMNAYLRQFIRSRELHLSAIPIMTPELERLLADVEADMRMEKNLSPAFSNAEAMDDYLDAL